MTAIASGTVALGQTLSSGTFVLPGGVRLAQLVALTILSLGLMVAILDRLAQGKTVVMVFVLFNNLGHWGMAIALAIEPGPDWMLPAFAALMLLGDLVKLVFRFPLLPQEELE